METKQDSVSSYNISDYDQPENIECSQCNILNAAHDIVIINGLNVCTLCSGDESYDDE